MNDFESAERMYLEANVMSYRTYSAAATYATVADVQTSHMNLATHYYKLAQSAESLRDKEAMSGRLDAALHNLYTCLTTSNRIPFAIQTSCLVTLEEIYKKYYGEVGDLALTRLYEMYPILLSFHANIDFVIDISPSMFGPRIEACQNTLLDIVTNQMKNGDVLSITAFEKRIMPVVTSCVLSEKNRESITTCILGLAGMVPVSGATYFYKTLLEVGNDIIRSKATKSRCVVALTDGADNERKTQMSTVKSFYESHGIKLIIVAVDVDNNQLESLASEPKYYITTGDDRDEIRKSLLSAFALARAGDIRMEEM